MTTSSPTTRRFGPWRRTAGLVQAAIFLGLPFVTLRGESALRFDVPSLRTPVDSRLDAARGQRAG